MVSDIGEIGPFLKSVGTNKKYENVKLIFFSWCQFPENAKGLFHQVLDNCQGVNAVSDCCNMLAVKEISIKLSHYKPLCSFKYD